MPDNIYKGPPYSIDDSYQSFFSETKESAFVPRALMVDFERTVVESIKGGLLSCEFLCEFFISYNLELLA